MVPFTMTLGVTYIPCCSIVQLYFPGYANVYIT